MPTDQAQALQRQALQRIRDQVIPAYAKLLTFFRDEYVPQARTTLAAEALPDGKAFYRQQIHEYTTLDLTPDAIHQIGLRRGREDPRADAASDAGLGLQGRLRRPSCSSCAPIRSSTRRRRTNC